MPHKESVEEYKKRVSSEGGKAIVKKFGKKHMSKLGKKGMNKRWGKKSKIKKMLFE